MDPRTTKTKNGAALITTRAEADVIPVYIMRKNNKFKLFRKTYVVIGDKIPYEALRYDPQGEGEYARVTGEIFDRVCTLGEEFERQKNETKKKKKAKKT